MNEERASKELVQRQFGAHAEAYATSIVHAKGASLKRLVELVKPQSEWLVLDVATGAGHTAAAFAPHVAHVIASDLTQAMLAQAQALARRKGLANMETARADAEALPFPAQRFDLVTTRIAPHHFFNIDAFLAETWRVLKPGGRFYCLEFSKVTSAPVARVYDAYSERALPLFGRLVARDAESYRYLHESIRRFPAQRELAERMRRAGFTQVAWRNLTLGVVALHSGWRI